jgi:hypothetical protein
MALTAEVVACTPVEITSTVPETTASATLNTVHPPRRRRVAPSAVKPKRRKDKVGVDVVFIFGLSAVRLNQVDGESRQVLRDGQAKTIRPRSRATRLMPALNK